MSVAEQRPDQAGEQYNIIDMSTGRQQAADMVRDCQTVVELNAKVPSHC